MFKIIEEFSAGADDQMEQLHDYIGKLQQENEQIVRDSQAMREQLSTLQTRT